MPTNFRALIAELVGTFILILFGCGAVHSAVLTGAQSGVWQVAIVWGLGVMFAAYAVGGISGAHINPAVTVALATWGRFPWRDVPGYAIAQVLGAFLAAAVLFVIFTGPLKVKEDEQGVKRGEPGSVVTAMCYGEYYPNPGTLASQPGPWNQNNWSGYAERMPTWAAVVAEIAATAMLAFMVFAVTDGRNGGAPPAWLAPLILGLTVAGLISIIGPLTQACLNPARDWGPRLFTFVAGWGSAAIPGPNGWAGILSVYLVAPIVGAVLGGGLYEYLLAPYWTKAGRAPERSKA